VLLLQSLNRNYQILIAEDNPADLYLLKEALRTHEVPCSIHSVASADEFLNYAREACDTGPPPAPDLVVLDWMLPKGNGPQLIRGIRETERCADAPILVLTSFMSDTDRATAMAAGANLILQKPTHLDDFIQIGGVLKQFLETQRPGSSR
jgi:chemotaxis family two-component system response regulator Rcp1